ncbi:unnamed protein product [Aureobasidium pullulans]|nr:unnamed protein product [Aureobasidium pullulans]CAD0031192.1 unnamed protein product [Aureobasidium pullulans]CAD0049436.1 unnamed protein product [Aureobasidium pullulans]
MPRDGSGAGDNAIEAGHNIVHGDAGGAAPMPEIEKGDSIEGMNASGGGLSGATLTSTGQGGNKEPFVEKEAEKHQ